MRLLRKIGLTAVLLGVLGFGSIWIGTDTASAGPYTGVIYGTVTNEAGEAVANANVEIYRRMGGYDYRYTSVRTDGGGQYRFSNLDIARDYKLGVNGSPYPYLTEYFDNKKDLNSADVFNLTDGVETNIDFVLAAYGSLSGTVTNEAGETIQGIRITAYDTTNRSVGSGSTDASGNYTIRNIPPGQYKMSTSSAYTKGYLDEYYNDKIDEESADPVQVVSSQETPGINFILTKGGVISGKITDASGLPVSNPYTSLYQEELRFYKYKFIMESDGISYRVIGLPTGSYSLQAKAGTVYPYTFIPEFYNDRTALEVADAIPVTVGQEVTGIDFSLELNGRVTGQVTDDAGNLLLYTSITIYSPSGSVVSGGSTGSSGTYVSITPPGTYYVHARGPCAWENGQYICYHKEYYDDAPDKLSAQLVTVASGVDTNIDFALSKGGSMAGRITDEDGNPLSDIYVFVYDTEWNYIDDTWNVDENGNYEITNLRAGDYHVQAYSYIPDSWGDPGDYLIEYYNDVKDWTMSVPVRVEANVQTTGIDFALTLGGSISGTVLDDSGNILPLSGYDLMVDAIDSNWESVTLGLTNDDGTYRIGGLLSGRYYVRTDSTYFGWEQNPDVIDEYYDDTVDWQDAKALSVKVGKDTPNINFNITLTGSGTTPTYEYGTVSGRVLDEAGNPIITTSGIYIYAYDSSGNYTGSGYTQNGYYTMNVTAGTRFLKTWVNNGSYMPEYYNDKQSLETADPVIVNANAETGGIDFVLARSGSISGRITDDSGNPLSGNIIVYDSQWNYVRYGYSDSSGYYTAYGPLPTGSYYVRAEHFYGSENLPTYYGNTIEQANALLVGVTVGQDTPNIDISLIKGGSISGVITDESSGSPVRGIGVTAYDAQWVYTRSSSTDSDGRYKITALTAGDYYLEATDNSGKYFDEYYNNKTTRETADTVSVALGQETTAINLALARTGSITGIVTDEYGMPVGGAKISLYSFNDGTGKWEKSTDWRHRATTSSNGTYNIVWLQTCIYRIGAEIKFPEEYSAYTVSRAYYPDTGDLAVAQDVHVTVGINTPDINIELPGRGTGTISGWYIDPNGSEFPSFIYCGTTTAYSFNTATGEWEDWGEAYLSGNSGAGPYAIHGMQSGSYVVVAYPDYCHWSFWVYDGSDSGANSLEGAAFVEVMDNTVTNVDITMPLRSSVSGRVTDKYGNPLEGIKIKLFNSLEQYVDYEFFQDKVYDMQDANVYTDADGRYYLNILPAGDYYVQAYDESGQYKSEYYVEGSGSNQGDMTLVYLHPGEETRDINIRVKRIIP